MELNELRKRALVDEATEFFKRGVYEIQIPGIDTVAWRQWYMRTDGSQFALVNLGDEPQIVCRFDMRQVDTFIPKLPTALKIHAWQDYQSERKCPHGTQTAFMEWVLRTECIVINYRDDLEYWECMARRLKRRSGVVLILFDREEKPYLREVSSETELRQSLELFPYACSGILGRIDQVEEALARA
ncbi:hypothetical protein GJV06_19170 [Enterobacteriaceae bacterium RIT691]|nr:hypothetical protein [Enterobacteriaceae bacterium RIT691]